MERILKGLVHLDDIIVMRRTFDELLKKLGEFFATNIIGWTEIKRKEMCTFPKTGAIFGASCCSTYILMKIKYEL